MKLDYKDGLLFTSINIAYNGKTNRLDNVVIDTGAAESMISPESVEDIGIYAELGDKIISFYGVGGTLHNAYEKEVDMVEIESKRVNNVCIDFGLVNPKGDINGLIGLDLLIKIGAIIDLHNMTIEIHD